MGKTKYEDIWLHCRRSSTYSPNSSFSNLTSINITYLQKGLTSQWWKDSRDSSRHLICTAIRNKNS